MKPKTLKTTQHTIELATGSETERLPIIIRKHPRSRSMVIRYQPLQHQICLTLPRHATIAQGLHFVEEKRSWLEKQLHDKAKHIPLTEGHRIPILGKTYTLCHVGGRGVVTAEDDRILVPGDAIFMKRRVREWLKQQVRQEIAALVSAKSQQLQRPYRKISLRDTISRWGSCSYDGNLSFSWRLAFAPRPILEYVVSHEVAHLKHHDHSPAFWMAVESLYPDHAAAREWLRTHGATLYAYG